MMRRRRPSEPELTILFATDLHGSESAYRKFLNAGLKFKPNLVVMGGDLAGKALVPVVAENGGHTADLGSRRFHVTGADELTDLEKTIRLTGRYPVRMSVDELQALQADPAAVESRFLTAMCDTLAGWLDLARERLEPEGIRMLAIAGNDDPPELDQVLAVHPFVEWVDGRVAELDDGLSLVGYSYVNPTHWDSPREYDEDRLESELSEVVGKLPDPAQSIWNIHVPPYNTGLDNAPMVDGELRIVMDGGQPRMTPVGSTALRAVIEQMQPLVGMHGHVHESRGRTSLGRTLVVNPGSAYSEGTLQSALIRVGRKGPNVQFLIA
jgi:Icc-related predicted phosphoesterase